MSRDEDRKIKLEIAQQCAPVLAGVKPSNLLILENTDIGYVVKKLEGTPVSKKVLWCSNKKSVWLIYREDQLKDILADWESAAFFKTCGYTRLTEIHAVLGRLRRRYMTYLESRRDFPHEMGLLLGYPIADVVGYIQNKGKNSLLCGYWKVYNDAEEAKRVFDIYNQVRKFIVEEIMVGKEFCQIVNAC